MATISRLVVTIAACWHVAIGTSARTVRAVTCQVHAVLPYVYIAHTASAPPLSCNLKSLL